MKNNYKYSVLDVEQAMDERKNEVTNKFDSCVEYIENIIYEKQEVREDITMLEKELDALRIDYNDFLAGKEKDDVFDSRYEQAIGY